MATEAAHIADPPAQVGAVASRPPTSSAPGQPSKRLRGHRVEIPIWSDVADLRCELAEDAPQLSRFPQSLPARVIELMPGNASLDLIHLTRPAFGLMVLDGLLLAELEAGRARTGWLVGAEDLFRPSALCELALTKQTHWRALTRSRIAVLDRDFGIRARGAPMVSRVLLGRATRTSNWLLAKGLIASSPLIEERLLLMFALCGERWGRVTPDGVAIRLPVTHATLAVLCGATRPSVTMALRSLQRRGWLECPAKGSWLLRPLSSDGGDRPSCFAEYERALGLASVGPPAQRSAAASASSR